jgi:Ca2+-binding EF-hand superfamily protein
LRQDLHEAKSLVELSLETESALRRKLDLYRKAASGAISKHELREVMTFGDKVAK